MYPCCLHICAVHNDFEAGNIHYAGHWKGWSMEVETFWGAEMAASEASAVWAQLLLKIFVTRLC